MRESFSVFGNDWERSPSPAVSDIGSLKAFPNRRSETTALPQIKVSPRSGDDARDGGGRAWLFMTSASLIEAFLWGFTTSYGIFLENYKDQPQFRDSHVLATVGTLASGIPFLGAPLVTTLVSRWPQYQRQMVWSGTLLCVCSLIGASFATRGWQLLLSQGIGYGTGVLIVYYPMLAMVNSWFTARRGFAYGVLFAAAGVSGTGLPFLIHELLEKFGYGWTLRGYALGIVVLVIPSFPFCCGRPSNNGSYEPSGKPKWDILRNPSLAIFSIATLFQGLAYYIPSLYLPSYASTLKLSTPQVVFLLALLNASQVIAQVLLGFVSDRASVFLLAPISTLGAAIWTLGLWYSSHNAASILAYSALFGLFTGGFTSLWARFSMSLSSDKATQEFAYGLLATQRGLGNVFAGPLSTALLRVGHGMSVPVSRQTYGPLTLFVAACMAVASLSGLGAFFHGKRAATSSLSSRPNSVWDAPRRYSRM